MATSASQWRPQSRYLPPRGEWFISPVTVLQSSTNSSVSTGPALTKDPQRSPQPTELLSLACGPTRAPPTSRCPSPNAPAYLVCQTCPPPHIQTLTTVGAHLPHRAEPPSGQWLTPHSTPISVQMSTVQFPAICVRFLITTGLRLGVWESLVLPLTERAPTGVVTGSEPSLSQ